MCVEVTHHFERPQRQEGVAALTVGPGVPAWVLALLQDELLPCEPVSVVTRPAERKHTEIRHLTTWFLSCIGQEVDEDRPRPAQQTHGSNSRSRLHDHRSDLLQSLLRHVFTLCRELRLTALEVLELEQHHLDDTWSRKSGGGRGGRGFKPAASPAVTSLPGYLVRGTGSTLALPSSQLLRGALLLRHPPDPPLLHFVAAAHTQTEHHPSGVHGWSTDRRTQEEETQCHSAVSNSPLNKRIVLMLL